MALRPNNNTIAAIIITFFLALCIIFAVGCSESPRDKQSYWTECGTCGAHVTNWWYVRNDANTDWIKVCQFCYQ